jgi:hypothetical protein
MQACLFGKLLILYQQINFIFTENELYRVYPVISKSTKQLKIFVVRAVNINLNPNLHKIISEIGTLFNDHGTFFEQLSPDL